MAEPLEATAIEQLLVKVEAMQAEITQLRTTVNALTPHPQLVKSEAHSTSRRKWLKRLALAGATATTALTLTPREAAASQSLNATAVAPTQTTFGVSGAPASIAPFQPSVTQFGVIGITDAAPTAGFAFKSGVFGFSPDGRGVFGLSSTGIGVFGTSDSGRGVLATSVSNHGVHGFSFGTNFGAVCGQAQSANTYSGLFNSSFGAVKAQLWLVPVSGTDTPSSGTHQAGELFVNNGGTNGNGNLYFCTTGNDTTVGTWLRLNSPYTAGSNITISAPNADGTFTLAATVPVTSVNGQIGAVTINIPVSSVNGQTGAVSIAPGVTFLTSPVRVAATTNAGGAKVLLTSQGATPVESGTSSAIIKIGGTNGIPSTAKGIIGSLGNVGASSGGNLRVWAAGTPVPTVNNLNVPGNLGNFPNLITAFTAALNATGDLAIGFASAIGATTGYTIDIAGYF